MGRDFPIGYELVNGTQLAEGTCHHGELVQRLENRQQIIDRAGGVDLVSDWYGYRTQPIMEFPEASPGMWLCWPGLPIRHDGVVRVELLFGAEHAHVGLLIEPGLPTRRVTSPAAMAAALEGARNWSLQAAPALASPDVIGAELIPPLSTSGIYTISAWAFPDTGGGASEFLIVMARAYVRLGVSS